MRPSKVAWAKFGKYSGPRVRGKCSYALPEHPDGFDLIVAATARPEGGAFDTVVGYDGTAVTYGLLQWTFTSGRLVKLLDETINLMGLAAWETQIGQELELVTGLRVDPLSGGLLHYGEKVTDFFSLRDVCTPPGGATPRTGPRWDLAARVARLFSRLGECPKAQQAQLEFFETELMREIGPKRPKMNGRRIADYLYPRGWERAGSPVVMVARALFFAMWQNSPRKAEQYLDGALRGFEAPLLSRKALDRLAARFARSTYGRWGNRKAAQAAKPYVGRYRKVALEVNRVTDARMLDPDLV